MKTNDGDKQKTDKGRGAVEIKIKKNFLRILLFVLLCGMAPEGQVQASIYNNPNVTFSPDKKAFTTNAGDKLYEWYKLGTTLSTGRQSTIRNLEKGEHYYKAERNGIIPVGKWKVTWETAVCCHSMYPPGTGYYHGIQYGRKSCNKYYYSGWLSYCADCGEKVSNMNIYMNKETAESITELDTSMDYYYLCPECSNLEQGAGFNIHLCTNISFNKYLVEYKANGGSGYMEESIHMYNNEKEYEGKPITPAEQLARNTYVRIGYEFDGWNTKPDGTGENFQDREKIQNLTSENYNSAGKGVVCLYAQWRKSESTLYIDPNGGSYQGKGEVVSVKGLHGSTYNAQAQYVQAPSGFTVSFDTSGGSPVKAIIQTMSFREWKMTLPFAGKLVGTDYTYLGNDGAEDWITAIYQYNSITLPKADKEDSSFGGWYYDPECTIPAGVSGEDFTPKEDTTLYAKWVDLVLTAKDNYSLNGGRGAVDLSWSQNDGIGKTYRLYQSKDNRNWSMLSDADDISEGALADASYGFSGREQVYTVRYAGIYTLTAQGAQGGNYKTYGGGYGGSVTGRFWLKAGEKITYTIGGVNGYNGGGEASLYAAGGGCTIVSTNLKGTILVAGGGGGAAPMGNGGAGGLSAGNIKTGTKGQSGGAGGGGGYYGGSAGELVVHNHVTGCYHYHTGNKTKGGGCYSKQNICGSFSFTGKERKVGFYYGTHYQDANGTWHQDGYCVRCASKNCAGHDVYETLYTCNKCGMDYGKSKPPSCTVTDGYLLSCKQAENTAYCGYTAGWVLSSKPAYGGSSYVNEDYAISHSQESGKRAGNGAFSICAENIGYLEEHVLKGVIATDKEPPLAIDLTGVRKTAAGSGKISVIWQEPEDRGTDYYHKAESYFADSLAKVSTSNITLNHLVSGVVGYYYLLDQGENTVVTSKNGQYTKEKYLEVPFNGATGYLHLAAADRAGNVSETIHIFLGVLEEEIGWPVMTSVLQIDSREQNIYPGGQADTYYVKADGESPFHLSFSGFLENQATTGYQVNHMAFESSCTSMEEQQITSSQWAIYTPNHPNITAEIIKCDVSQWDKTINGPAYIRDDGYTEMKRSDYCKKLTINQRFVLMPKMDGESLRVTPIAGADRKAETIYSDYSQDILHSIYLIGDGTSPSIAGTEIWEELKEIDRNQGEKTVYFTATDNGSGLKEFYAVIANQDNGSRETIYASKEGTLALSLTSDYFIYNGSFTVTLHAVDNVGNETVESYGSQEFSLTVSVERILAPHTPVFRRGESGILYITTTGYADRVEVIFPKELAMLDERLNQTYVYEVPSYCQEEELGFMIPLKAPTAEFQIIVRAYKDGTEIERYPSLRTIDVEGSVLEDIRTRLR